MKTSRLFPVVIFLAAFVSADAQTIIQRRVLPNPKVYVAKSDAIKEKPAPINPAKTNQTTQQITYVRPTAKSVLNATLTAWSVRSL